MYCLAKQPDSTHLNVTDMPETTTLHNAEPHAAAASGRLNWLRAGVLGANDGIVSVAGIVIGVAAATVQRGPIFTAGIAGLAAMAATYAIGTLVGHALT